jgi:hypothetical protein
VSRAWGRGGLCKLGLWEWGDRGGIGGREARLRVGWVESGGEQLIQLAGSTHPMHVDARELDRDEQR